MPQAVGAQLRSFNAGLFQSPSDYGVDEVSGQRAFVAMKNIIVGAERRNLQEKTLCLVGNGDSSPAHFTVNDYSLLLDVVLQERAHLAGTHPTVYQKDYYRLISLAFYRMKKLHQLSDFKRWHEGLGAAWRMDSIHGVGDTTATACKFEEGFKRPVYIVLRLGATLDCGQKPFDGLRLARNIRTGIGKWE